MATFIKAVNLKQSKFSIKVNIKVDDFIQELQKFKNEKGWVNFEIKERKEVGNYGETHSLTLDEWKPNTQVKKEERREIKKEVTGNVPDKLDDLPF